MSQSYHPLYPIFNAMVARCHLPTNESYKDYGARGIKVCEEWKNNFSKFLEDMSPKPEGTSLERLDNEKGYSKDNCTWVTFSEQNKNQRRRKNSLEDKIIVEIFYSPLPVMFLVKKYGVDKRTVYGIKKKKHSQYTTDVCNRYILVQGELQLKSTS
jgi:hypothetical protein